MKVDWTAFGGVATVIGGVVWILSRLRSAIVFTEDHISCAIPKDVSLPESAKYESTLHAHKLQLSNWSLRHLEDVRLSVDHVRNIWGWEVDRASSIDKSEVKITIEDRSLKIYIANMPRLEKITLSIVTYDWILFYRYMRGSSKTYRIHQKHNVQGLAGLIFYGSLITPFILHLFGII